MEANTTKYSAIRAPGREHVPLYPKGFIAVRILQLVFAVIVLGLGAYGLSWLAFDGDIFIVVVAIMTLITSIYHLVAEYSAIALYNSWAVLSLDILLVIMWLSSFALLASEVAALFAYSTHDYWYGYSYGLSGYGYIVVACLAAASAVGAIQFILHIVSLVIHSINLHRHRAAGLHCTPGAAATPVTVGGAPGAEKIQVVYQTAPQPTPSPVPAYQQGYPVQIQPQPQQQQQQQFYPQQIQPQPQQQQQFYPQQIQAQQGQVPIQQIQQVQ